MLVTWQKKCILIDKMNEEKRIYSVDEFLKIIIQMTIATKKDVDVTNLFWFRGESSINFKTPLVPNGYRVLADTFKDNVDDLFKSEHIKQLEKNISAEFYRKALPYIISKGIENNSWNRYFLMQHYNIYTRLLDWTENALIALHFAVCENPKVDAKVWILQPFNLNSFAIKTILSSNKDCWVIPPTSAPKIRQELRNENGELQLNELTRRYLMMDFEHKDSNYTDIYYPIAIYPSFLDERISAQKGCFTIFGNKINGLQTINNYNDKILDWIIIDGNSKEKIMKELQLIGIDYNSIYPDLDGLGKSITNKYRRDFYDNEESIVHMFESIKKKIENNNKAQHANE